MNNQAYGPIRIGERKRIKIRNKANSVLSLVAMMMGIIASISAEELPAQVPGPDGKAWNTT